MLLYSHKKEDLIEAARIIANEIMEKMQSNLPQNIVPVKEEFLTQKEAAEFLHITVGTLIEWKKSGKIPFSKIGRAVLFSKKELQLLMEAKSA